MKRHKPLALLAMVVLTASVTFGQQGIISPARSDPAPKSEVPGTENSMPAPTREFVAKDIFHIVGLPNLQRNNRLDLTLFPDEMRFEKKGKILLAIPYTRVRQIEVISGERHYGKATYAAAIATPFAVGSLFILKKRHVDTFLLEFVNEKNGLMNVIVQFPQGQGVQCGEALAKHGLIFETSVTSQASAERKKVEQPGGKK